MDSKYISKLSALLLAAGAVTLTSCQQDEFGEGDGALQLKMEVSATLTRSNPENLQELRDGCTVYLSSSKGLIYKFKGVDNVPATIPLKSGAYVAEAWTGDSVSASFDKKFYRGYQPFEIERGAVKEVTVNCHIANAVVGVDADASIAEVLKNYTVTVSHTRGSLEFTSDMDAAVRGYFMMPNEDTTLKWVIEGEDFAGNPVHKEGSITGVQRAHEYMIRMTHSGGSNEPFGGSLITVTIDDRCLVVEDVVTITGAPSIKGVGFDLESGLSGEPGKWERRSVYVRAIGSLTSLRVHAGDAAALGLPVSDFDFITMDDADRATVSAAGLTCEYAVDGDYCNARLFLEAAMLNRLPEGEYPLEITATDSQGKRRVRTLKIQVTDADVKIVEGQWQDVYATKATLHGVIMKESAQTPGFRYRKQGTAEWTEVIGTVNGTSYSAQVTGLTPGTTYEYQAMSATRVNSSTMTFTTESIFVIPNAGFEEWSTFVDNNKVIMPSASGTKEWWDSGNHGSATMSKTLTDKSSTVKHSGQYSVYMQSMFVGVGSIGAFAAGNIFAGTYDKTNMATMGGELTFGRPFNGSRPVKLVGYCYYKPATVNHTNPQAPIKEGDQDQGIVYVALTTGVSKIVANKESAQVFDKNGDGVVAYGEMVFTGEYGSMSEMKRFEITLQPMAAYNLKRATHIILTAASSRYGDFFAGADGSVMYLDDLEFIY